MSDAYRLRRSLPATSHFDYLVRHCPKCGWAGSVADVTLRYCGPGQRAEGDWAEMFLFGEAGPPPCEGSSGEHFHWQCARCRFRRVLAVPGAAYPGVN